MISFDLFHPTGDLPIYVQIVRFIKRQIVSGIIKNGDSLPSRRVLSALLGINPNTVQKAYRMLEDEGLIESRSGAISCAVVNAQIIGRLRDQLTETDILSVVAALKQAGITKSDALRLIEQNWEGGEPE